MEIKNEKKPIIKANKISKDTEKNLKIRTISAIVLALICFPILFVGGWPFFVLISLVSLFAINEIIKSTNKGKMPVLLYGFIYVVAISLIFWVFIKNNLNYYNNNSNQLSPNVLATGFSSLYLSTIAIAISFGGMFLVSIADEKFSIQDITYYFTLTILLALGIQSIFFLRYLPLHEHFSNLSYYEEGYYKYGVSVCLFIYFLSGTMLTDIGAYFFGVLFGKNKMNPRISPKKTWEGFFGGVFTSIVFSLLFAFILDWASYPVLKGVLDCDHWYNVLIISIAMPLFTTLGDLAFSAIKRHFNIKDFGKIIPGHGGILDRIDSLLFAATGVASLIIFMLNNWNFAI